MREPQTTLSDVTRPYVISVDADIPEGTSVRVISTGVMPGGAPWSEEFTNPVRAPFTRAWCETLLPILTIAPDSLAAPFLYGVVIEGDGLKTVDDAERLAEVLDIEAMGWVIMRPKNGRPFLTTKSFPLTNADVEASEISRPYMFQVFGNTPHGSRILFSLQGTDGNGTPWKADYEGPCRETVPVQSLGTFGYSLTLLASPRGTHTPCLYGISVEGDGRRFYLSAARLAETLGAHQSLDVFQLLNLSEDQAVLILRPEQLKPSRVIGPPTALLRLDELFQQGKLRVTGVDD